MTVWRFSTWLWRYGVSGLGRISASRFLKYVDARAITVSGSLDIGDRLRYVRFECPSRAILPRDVVKCTRKAAFDER